MKHHRQELWFEVSQRRQLLNITPELEQAVRASGVQEGLLLCNAMHITASVFINDDESGLHADYEQGLERLAPEKPHSQYRHNRTGEDNADGHLKRTIMGREVVVAITAGGAGLGPGGRRFFCALWGGGGAVGADLLRRVRWDASEAGPGEDHRGVS